VSGRLLVTDSTQAGSAVEKVIVASPGSNFLIIRGFLGDSAQDVVWSTNTYGNPGAYREQHADLGLPDSTDDLRPDQREPGAFAGNEAFVLRWSI